MNKPFGSRRSIRGLLLGALAVLAGCAYDNAEDLFKDQPAVTCDVSAVTYASTISPILTQNCRVCHNSQITNGNVNLENYADVKRIASSGLLVGVVSHAPGYKQMPFGLPKLADCDIARIKKWVDDGAPNN
ncbi:MULTISPECIES: hypothetical protein [Hymenobacter]|uniref:Cytochrome c domain-containing protein n=1 Tax=Hymenobacter jejuensis TaxID=2502781 RepID=A0A5B8A051_9BACT|nr:MULTISPECIES: hypothetical protein [Hymenobacter]MBC6990742.1 hypothetical protein [Hymenobacter sp. BT491]QDA60854.1 hypothetical protein FHG12_12400 [Hymenobacter jejuensis]